MRPTNSKAWWKVAAIPALLAGCFTGVFGDDYKPLHCAGDPDCAVGQRCLRDRAGSSCKSPEQTTCSAVGCAPGTTCSDGTCRTVCEGAGALSCLNGQACKGAVCVGDDPTRDPPVGGTGGAGGAGGASSAGGGGAGGSAGGAACGHDNECPGGICIGSACLVTCASYSDCPSTPCSIGGREVCNVAKSIDGHLGSVCGCPAVPLAVGTACNDASQCSSNVCANNTFCSLDCGVNGPCGELATCMKVMVDSGLQCFPNCNQDSDCKRFGPGLSCKVGTTQLSTSAKVCAM